MGIQDIKKDKIPALGIAMGNITASPSSNLPQYVIDAITSEYKRISTSSSSTSDDELTTTTPTAGLTLDQFLTLKLDHLQAGIPLMDVSTIVLADKDYDGLYSLTDLIEFSTQIYTSYCTYNSQDLVRGEIETVHSLVRGKLIRELWLLANASNGIQDVSDRITTILTQNRQIKTFATQPGIEFIDSATVHVCFRICSISRSNRVDFQTFFDLMQQAAEDRGLMDLEDVLLDDMLPLEILQTFIRDFFVGVTKMHV